MECVFSSFFFPPKFLSVNRQLLIGVCFHMYICTKRKQEKKKKDEYSFASLTSNVPSSVKKSDFGQTYSYNGWGVFFFFRDRQNYFLCLAGTSPSLHFCFKVICYTKNILLEERSKVLLKAYNDIWKCDIHGKKKTLERSIVRYKK